MADDEEREAEVLAAVDTTVVTRDVLNEAMASLKTSMVDEVQAMLKNSLRA